MKTKTKEDARHARMCDPMCEPWMKGYSNIARIVGRSRAHVWYVLNGKRKCGKQMAEALVSLGYKVGGNWYDNR